MTAKIIYIITRSDIGGAQNHVISLLEYFNSKYDLVLVSGGEGPLLESARAIGVSCYTISSIDSFNFAQAIVSLRKVLIKEKPDLVHTHSSLASLYGRLAARLGKFPVVYTVHGWHFANLRNNVRTVFQIFIERLLKSITRHWIVVSKYDYDLGVSYNLVDAKSLSYIPNGVADIGFSSIANDVSSNNLNLLFIGRASEQKNCIGAIDVLEKTDTNVTLAIYTSGDDADKVLSRVKSSPIVNRCKVIVDDLNAGAKVVRYDLMLVTSRYEGMPLSVLEGLRAALPIISTDVCGMNELVTPQNGFLLEQDAPQAMADKINLLNRDRSLLLEMGQASRQLYESKYTDHLMCTKTEKVYQEILAWCVPIEGDS